MSPEGERNLKSKKKKKKEHKNMSYQRQEKA